RRPPPAPSPPRPPRTRRASVGEIRNLKARTRPAPLPDFPPSCRGQPAPAGAATGKPRSPSILNGTYHLLFTKEDARAFGPPADSPQNMKTYPGVETRVLNDGKWRFGGRLHGTYAIRGHRITLTSAIGQRESFDFSLRAGTLRLKPILPMDPGDQWVDAGEPWHRVGQPSPLQ